MNVGTPVALAASAGFTGAVERVDGTVYTVRFDAPAGRGWLRAEHLVELPTQKGDLMKKDTPVALTENPNVTGRVLSVDGDEITFTYDGTGGSDMRMRHELREVTTVGELPDKSWPPATMETKNRPT
jgi:hypothetical protein